MLQVGGVGQELHLLADDVFVPSDSRACLSFLWRKFMKFAGCLVYQRKHHFKRHAAMLVQKLFSKPKAMVGEIAAENGCQMQILAVFAVQLIHFAGNV